MNKAWKTVSTYVVAGLISIGASYGTYSYLNSRSDYSSSDVFSYGQDFDQKNVHLASLTAEGYPDFTKAAESSLNAVVHIKSTVKASENAGRRQRQMVDPFEYFFGFGDRGGSEQMQPKPMVGYGSGVIISKDGYIITNNHVIDKATEIEVTMNDNRKYVAKLVGADPNTDIALLKIEGAEFAYVPFGNSDELKVGEWVLAVGNPFNLTSTVTAGIVSAKGRGNIGSGKSGGGDMTIQSFIQTDAAINPGNSGGALVNTSGQLVGINTAIYSQTGNFAGYGFAVPISIAGKVVADLKEFGTVQRAVLGVQISDVSAVEEISPEKAKNLKVKEGVYVGGFADRSPAKEAGIQEGDVIVGINKAKVRNVGELQDLVNRYRPGDKVEVTIDRNGSKSTIAVVLKNSAGNTSVVKKTDGLAVVGAAFKALTEEQKKQYGISYGVEVAGVDDGGKFKKEGITKGFIIMKINNQPVTSAESVEQMIDAIGKSQDKALFISGFYPNGKTKYYAIDLND